MYYSQWQNVLAEALSHRCIFDHSTKPCLVVGIHLWHCILSIHPELHLASADGAMAVLPFLEVTRVTGDLSDLDIMPINMDTG